MVTAEEVLNIYFEAHRELVAADGYEDGVIISLPLHFSAYHRVELGVSRLPDGEFIITDMGGTIGELRDAGHTVEPELLERMKDVFKLGQIELSGNTLMRRCGRDELGKALHDLSEACKTFGDICAARRRSRLSIK